MTAQPLSLDEALLSDDFVSDPYPTYARLRDEDPVHRVEQTSSWLITRYEDVAFLFPQHALFSSFGFQDNYFRQLRPELRRVVPALEARGNSANVLTTDPPAHTRLRKALQAAFTPEALRSLELVIREIVASLLDAVDTRSPSFDFMEALAYPAPALVLAKMLGAEGEDCERMQRWSTSYLVFMSRPDPNAELTVETASAAEASLLEWYDYLEKLIASRRSEPRDDIATALVMFGDNDDQLTSEELLSNFVLFMGAGHETTTGLLANGMYALLSHPTQFGEVRSDRSLLRGAIEEMLRWENPVQRLRRTVATDFELHGKMLRRGDAVELVPGSANRDPRQFPEPDAFDIHRSSRAHLSFGKGIHFCIGAPLARLEAQVAFNVVLDRCSKLRLEEGWEPTWMRSSLLRRLTNLPVRGAGEIRKGLS